MLNITQDFIPMGRKNRPRGVNPCTYITIHETGNAAKGSGAKNHAAYLKSDSAANAYTSWHYTVDDKTIYHHIPDAEHAYHAGDGAKGTGNTASIGIELCVNPDSDFELALHRTAELVAHLMTAHGIPISNVVQHNHWNGKNCPQTIRRAGRWGEFLALCQSAGIQTLEDALAHLTRKGILNSPDYWAAQCPKVAHLEDLILKFAQAI